MFESNMKKNIYRVICGQPKVTALVFMAVPLFITVYLLIFLNLDILNRRVSQVEIGSLDKVAQIRALAKLQHAIDDFKKELALLKEDKQKILNTIHKVAQDPVIEQPESQKIKEDLYWLMESEKSNLFGQSLNMFNSNFDTTQMNCLQIGAIHKIHPLKNFGPGVEVYLGLHGFTEVAIISPKANCDIHFSIPSEDCKLKNELLFYKVLMQFFQGYYSSSIVSVLGHCGPIQDVLGQSRITSNKKDPQIPPAFVIDYGAVADLQTLCQMNWIKKMQTIYSLTNLLKYLYHSAQGSLRLDNFSPKAFILKGQEIKLFKIADLHSDTPTCEEDIHCKIKDTEIGVKCVKGECENFNQVWNILHAHKNFFTPLLTRGPLPPNQYLQELDELFEEMLNLEVGYDIVLQHIHGVILRNQFIDIKDWEKNKNKTGREFKKKLNVMQRHGTTLPNVMSFIYDKKEHVDVDHLHDYYCIGSRVQWACVFSVAGEKEGFSKCSKDPRCKAFVATPHTKRKDWLTIFLKKDAGNPLYRHAATLFVKRPLKIKEYSIEDILQETKKEDLVLTESVQWKTKQTKETDHKTSPNGLVGQ